MTHIVTQAPATQNFSLGVDSKSVQTGVPNLCGPIEYSIVEAYTFATITYTSETGTISIASDKMSDIGVKMATFQAKLTNYPNVAPVQVTFTINLIDPCLSTVLTLPTTLTDVTIGSMSGVQESQLFAPATDSAATSAGVVDLCGPRAYSIVEATAQNFISIVSPVTTDWTINFLSTNLADVGVHTITL